MILDDLLGTRNSSQEMEFSTKEKHEALVVYDISQSYFGLSRQSSRNDSDNILRFKCLNKQ